MKNLPKNHINYAKYVREHFNDIRKPVFRLNEIKMIGISGPYLKLLIHKLTMNGEITRITKGTYTSHKDADVVGFAFRPFYYGLEDALSIRGYSLQGTNPTIITVRNVRRGIRKFRDRNYVLYRIDKKLFFGYELIKHGDFWIPVSDLEKTVLDMAYFNLSIRDEIWPVIKSELNRQKISSYLVRYPLRVRKKIATNLKKRGLVLE